MKDFLGCLRDFFSEVCLPFAIVGGVGGGLLLAVVAAMDFIDCQGFAAGTGLETRWRWGCYAKTDDGWVPKKYAFGSVNELRVRQQPHK